jgi:uncharacterized membrane protein YqjE
VKYAIAYSIRALVACLLDYLELRLKLLGLEAREAGFHLLLIGLLVVTTLAFLAGSLVLLVVFILYVMTLTFHLSWGWCALILAGVLFLISIVTGITFRFRLSKSIFPVTLAEFQKDRQWLKHDMPSAV